MRVKTETAHYLIVRHKLKKIITPNLALQNFLSLRKHSLHMEHVLPEGSTIFHYPEIFNILPVINMGDY